MPTQAKTDAIAHITRAVAGLETAIAILQDAYVMATFTERRELLRLITELAERLDINRIFLAHLKTIEVTVSRPSAGAYDRLDRALARLQRIDVATNSVIRIMNVAAALGRTVRSSRREVSRRAT